MKVRRIEGVLKLQFTRAEVRAFWIWLALCPVLLALFGALTYLVLTGPNELTRFDEGFGLRLQQERQTTPGLIPVWEGITHAGNRYAMAGLAMVAAAILWVLRERLLALGCLFVAAGGGALNQIMKKLFDRDRPEFKDLVVFETNKSYPSGHAMSSLIGYGLVAFVLFLMVPYRSVRIIGVTLLTVIVLLVGYSRAYLGAHYLSDVLGGYAVAGAWMAAALSVMQALRMGPPEEPVSRPAEVRQRLSARKSAGGR